ncbi:TonB-linked SusC/RagA family outer membrane protein [Pedobacter sp. AK017]|uniref:SusC/RagA family TonB-linked outer membrane protein n=1 Tax=Pedobacter sp. AK017 TaxID=2723073 RepID=UPI00160DE227|nr:SusC/RagA family TonB-linked outer membrane protein [Pedobacter sp. AK017]MBB5439614.1 TonB-linked SusC/RagA family outer membrane protein [Pedobacter sp. AK017]
MQVSASTFGQRITINQDNASIKSVFREIRKQSGYSFFYDGKIISENQKVSVKVTNVTVDEALNKVLGGLNLTYTIDGKIISIKEKEKSTLLEKVIDRFQTIDVRGRVVDQNNSPLRGATIKVRGSTVAVTSDGNGEFILKDVVKGVELEISFIGFAPTKIFATEELGIIRLAEVNAKLDEVIVQAYGTTTQRYSTSNIGTINADAIGRQPVTNVMLALQGRVPGLFIQQRSGVSASPVVATVQGKNSLRNNNEPFYVVDGIPYSPQFTNNSLMGGAIVGVGGSALGFINPADIESVSILKDADATAIYGSRAANGAILITTKKGKAGKTSVDLNIQNGWGRVVNKLELLNTQQYLEILKEGYFNAGFQVPTESTDANSSNFPLTLWNKNRYTDWQEELAGGTAKYNNINASVSGGNLNTQFMASYGFLRETTVYPGNLANEKGNLHFNLNHQSNDSKFTYSLSGTYLQDRNTLNAEDLWNIAIQLAPNAPALYKEDGSLNWEPYPNDPTRYSFDNPLSYMEQKYTGKTKNFLGNSILGYEIVPGLQLKLSGGLNSLNGYETKIVPLTSYKPDASAADKIRSAQYLNKSIDSWIIEPLLTYSKTTGFGNFNVLLGGTLQETNTLILQQTGSGQPNDSQIENLSAATLIRVNTDSKSQYKYNAVFARLNYLLEDKYVVNLNLRRDGSSRFGSQNRFHTFYSIGGAWLFGNEKAIKKNARWLSAGKLRANYGTTGNDQITDYRFLSLLRSPSYNTIPYLQSPVLEPFNITNPFLQWEETRKLNLGIDLGFIGNSLAVNIDYFRNRSSNQLLPYVVPSITGFTAIDRNIPATVQNSGIEVVISAKFFKNKPFSWTTSLNQTIPRNKLIAFPGLETSTYANQYILGQPTSILKKFESAGVNSETGLFQFINSKGEFTSDPNSTTDRTQVVNLNPKFYGGWSNSVSYKGLNLDFLFTFTRQIGETYKFGNYPGITTSNQPITVLDRWKSPGDMTALPKVSMADDAVVPFITFRNDGDGIYGDASYVRLKNISLSYSLPATVIKSLRMTRARLFMQGQNMMTITKYIGTDPETLVTGALPPLRTISIGVQATF